MSLNLDSAELSDLASVELAPKRPVGRPPKTPIITKMTELVELRWDATRADEAAIRSRYRTDLTVEDGLTELAHLRKLCEIAGSEINQRLNHVDEKCESCGSKMDGRRPPTMIEPFRDPTTGTVRNKFYCSIICVQKRNLKKLGLEQLVK